MGQVSTLWYGNASNCLINGIVLLHSRFTDGIYGTCNNGAIVARILSVEGNNYTSQLNVTVTPETAGKTVMCASDDGITFKSPVYTRPLIQIRIQIKVIQILYKRFNPLLIQIS